ncbi:MAG: BNR-4 repeat-containing protein [Planctomycetota bacterium]
MITQATEIVPNAGWCWYQGPRTIVDSANGNVIFSSIASGEGVDGDSVGGDVQVTTWNPATHEAQTVKVGHFDGDDHDVAALWERPDGRYLVVYTCHNHGWSDKQPKSFYRISTHPHDATDWQDEQVFSWPTTEPIGNGIVSVTYSNLFHLTEEGGDNGVLYNIARASGQLWRIATSDDWGETWTLRGILSLPPEGGRAYSNGYTQYATNSKDRIDFTITQAHPRDYNNGVYHGYIHNGQTHDANGNVLDPETFSEQAPLPEDFTPLFKPEQPADGAYHTGWTIDLTRCPDDSLHALFSCRVGVESVSREPLIRKDLRNPLGDADHRLFYGKLVDGAWQTTELCKMGIGLYDNESDYVGLGAIDPIDGQTLYVSTPIDPRDGLPIHRHELFKATTPDGGQTWDWEPITEQSVHDNLRPQVVALPNGRRALLWLRGRYWTMHKWDQQAVGLILD